MVRSSRHPPGARAVGIPSFRKEDYARAKAVMTDGTTFRDFDDLERRTKAALKQLADEGLVAERVYLDPDEFMRWCRARQIQPDADARRVYAGMEMARRYPDQS